MATITTAGHRAAIGHVIITKTENRKAISRAITIMLPPVAESAGLTSRAAVTTLATAARRKAATSPVEVTTTTPAVDMAITTTAMAARMAMRVVAATDRVATARRDMVSTPATDTTIPRNA